MAAKKVRLQVVADGIQVDGRWHHNGQVFSVSQPKARKLLADGTVVVRAS